MTRTYFTSQLENITVTVKRADWKEEIKKEISKIEKQAEKLKEIKKEADEDEIIHTEYKCDVKF